MAEFEGGNNPHNSAHVNSRGQIEAHAISAAEQEQAAIDGDAYNFNTSNLILTDDLDTPIFFLQNDTEDRGIIISRIFVAFGVSTGAPGLDIEGTIIYNPTGGDILTATAKAPQNFSTGSNKTLGVTSTVGATLKTVSGGSKPIEFLFPTDKSRNLVPFQSIVIPRGGSIAFTIKPGTANTSMKIQAGYNAFLAPKA